MSKMSDLPGDLVGEILSRVPMVSLSAVRSTNKKWNSLSKNRIFGMAPAARKQFMGFMMMDYRVCFLRFDLHGIGNDRDFIDPSIKQIGKLKLNRVAISQVFHFDGLLLCATKNNSSLVVWNPYLGQTRWIQPRNHFHELDMYSLGYGSNNRNHQILRIFDPYVYSNFGFEFEIYDFSSDSWRLLDVTPDWHIPLRQRGVSLNGNAYFFAKERKLMDEDGAVDVTEVEDFLLCFDFTTERFESRLALPIHSHEGDLVTLSCVRSEQLAVLHKHWKKTHKLEIWVTSKIEPNVVSWSKFLKLDLQLLTRFVVHYTAGSFFIDEEKKVAVVFDLDRYNPTSTCHYQAAHIIGEDGYFKSVNIGEALLNGRKYCLPVVSSFYVPSLVQVQINQPGKRKLRGY